MERKMPGKTMQPCIELAGIAALLIGFQGLVTVKGMIDPSRCLMINQGLVVVILFLVTRHMAFWRIVYSVYISAIRRNGALVPVAHTQYPYASVASVIGCPGKLWNIMWPEEMSTKQRKGCSAMNRKGFTLIELLIVIAILGILVALILPRFGDVQANANTKVCVANLRGLASAMATYETMNNAPSTSWGTAPFDDPAYMVTNLNLMAQEPFCPYAVEAATSYVLHVQESGPTPKPDYATCPEVGTYADHVWP